MLATSCPQAMKTARRPRGAASTTAPRPEPPAPIAEHIERIDASVLVVDDEEMIRKVVGRALAGAGCSVTYARNGDRLVVIRYESNDKSDGLGQHETSHTLETVRLE